MLQQNFTDRARVNIRFIQELEGGRPTPRMDMDKVNTELDLFGYALAPVSYSDLKKQEF